MPASPREIIPKISRRIATFRFDRFCEPLVCAVMHGYSVYADFARSRTDPNVVPFLCQLMQSLSGKAVLFNEFGNPACPRRAALQTAPGLPV